MICMSTQGHGRVALHLSSSAPTAPPAPEHSPSSRPVSPPSSSAAASSPLLPAIAAAGEALSIMNATGFFFSNPAPPPPTAQTNAPNNPQQAPDGGGDGSAAAAAELAANFYLAGGPAAPPAADPAVAGNVAAAPRGGVVLDRNGVLVGSPAVDGTINGGGIANAVAPAPTANGAMGALGNFFLNPLALFAGGGGGNAATANGNAIGNDNTNIAGGNGASGGNLDNNMFLGNQNQFMNAYQMGTSNNLTTNLSTTNVDANQMTVSANGGIAINGGTIANNDVHGHNALDFDLLAKMDKGIFQRQSATTTMPVANQPNRLLPSYAQSTQQQNPPAANRQNRLQPFAQTTQPQIPTAAIAPPAGAVATHRAAPSPELAAFRTPTQGPSPCGTPPTPTFHDAHSVLPQGAQLNGSWQQPPPQQNQQLQPLQPQSLQLQLQQQQQQSQRLQQQLEQEQLQKRQLQQQLQQQLQPPQGGQLQQQLQQPQGGQLQGQQQNQQQLQQLLQQQYQTQLLLQQQQQQTTQQQQQQQMQIQQQMQPQIQIHQQTQQPHIPQQQPHIPKQQMQQQQIPQQQPQPPPREEPQAPAPAGSLLSPLASLVGSTLGRVATYVNRSLRSGIPFHVADKAMRESRETHARWWEQGINDEADDDGGEGGGDSDATDEGGPKKRRKLESGRAAAGGDASSAAAARGSALSASLTKRYGDMGVDVDRGGATADSARWPGREARERPRNRERRAASDDDDDNAEGGVDGSIIAPRRRRGRPDGTVASAAAPGGYDMFNDMGGMYDFGGDEAARSDEDGAEPSAATYDSSGSCYAAGRGEDDDGADGDEEGAESAAAVAEDAGGVDRNESPAAAEAPDGGGTTRIDGQLNTVRRLLEEKDRAHEESELLQMLRSPREFVKKSVRSELIDALTESEGDVTDARFLSCLDILANFYKTSGRDARASPWARGGPRRGPPDPGGTSEEVGGPASGDLLEGYWLNVSRPTYVECLGRNPEGDPLYTLGRMSFDMFRPGGLVCSVQSTHNAIRIVGEREELPHFVPKSLREEVASLCDAKTEGGAGRPMLRSYDIAVSLTIEPPSSVGQPEPDVPNFPMPSKRMRAIMSVKGYVLPDPDTPNRLTVWFTGGKLSPGKPRTASGKDGDEMLTEDEEDQSRAPSPAAPPDGDDYGDLDDWTALFASKWRKTLGERARAMAAKLLLGADLPNKVEEEGHMEYALHRPVGGHGKVYVDVVYLDEDILIMKGHRGTIYAMARSGVSQRYRDLRKGKSKAAKK
ncbi:hypothetical protein ACHAWF_008780 [Thalassiosira exigua]